MKERVKHYIHKLTGNPVEPSIHNYINFSKPLLSSPHYYDCNSTKQLKTQCLESAKLFNLQQTDTTLIKLIASIRTVVNSVLGFSLFPTQIIAALALNDGKLVDMKTGEGKTLTAVIASIINALQHRKVFVITFNDYLANRDAHFSKPIYDFFDLTVGAITAQDSREKRKRTYDSDIIYITANELGFDLLRDQLCYDLTAKIVPELEYAIVDEADAIMIDRARTPLIIAGLDEKTENHQLIKVTSIISTLNSHTHYQVDKFKTNIFLTAEGAKIIEKTLGCGNLYDEHNIELLTKINLALQAKELLKIDVDYIIQRKRIILIDKSTGRVMPDQRWPDGLYTAVEIKEHLNTSKNNTKLNITTIQQLLVKFNKLSGMSGTAADAAHSLFRHYNLKTVIIPRNMPNRRVDLPDRIFPNIITRDKALLKEIKSRNMNKQPILIGSPNIYESERIYNYLKANGVQCQLINAKSAEQEAELIRRIACPGNITISTNIAGRGTDIILGPNNQVERNIVVKAGGLHIIGTSRFESIRIDKQLIGRAGRQNDPGSSQFFLCLDDNILLQYGSYELARFSNLQTELQGNTAEKARKTIHHVQRIAEGVNSKRRTNLLRYSKLIEKQRSIVNILRNKIQQHDFSFLSKESALFKQEKFTRFLQKNETRQIITTIFLYHIDTTWIEYLGAIDTLKEGIHLIGAFGTNVLAGGQDPYIIFLHKADNLFQKLFTSISQKVEKSIKEYTPNSLSLKFYEKIKSSTFSAISFVCVDNPFEQFTNKK